MLKRISFPILSGAAALDPPLFKTIHFSSCLFKAPLPNFWAPLIGQLTNAWPSTINIKKEQLCLINFCLYKCLSLSRSVISQSHRIQGRTIDEAFRRQRFLRVEGPSVGADFDLFYFLVLLHAQQPS